MQLKADLHTHSRYSDGKYTPQEVCQRAKANGVQLLSITDHDTMGGSEEKQACAKANGLLYVVGWEVSAYLGATKVHITGYNCQQTDDYFRFLQQRIDSSYARAEENIQKLKELGFQLTIDDVRARLQDKNGPIHTSHVARAAAACSGGLSSGFFMSEYLTVGKPAFSSIGRPTPQDAIEIIHTLGGIASIAHPGRITLDFENKENLIKALCAYGVDGIEAVYTTHTKQETEYFLSLAEKFGLLVTGGSDTHAERGNYTIGSPLFYPSETLLEKLGINI